MQSAEISGTQSLFSTREIPLKSGEVIKAVANAVMTIRLSEDRLNENPDYRDEMIAVLNDNLGCIAWNMTVNDSVVDYSDDYQILKDLMSCDSTQFWDKIIRLDKTQTLGIREASFADSGECKPHPTDHRVIELSFVIDPEAYEPEEEE